jgi:hypothetical protein
MPTRNAERRKRGVHGRVYDCCAGHNRLPPRRRALGTARVAVAATTIATAIGSSATAVVAATTVALTSTVATTAAAVRRSAVQATAHATHVTGRRSATATATSSTTATSTKARALAGNVLEEAGNILVRFLEELHEVTNDATVATVEERSRETGVASTTSTTDTMNVVVDVGREVIVDDVGHVGYIKST